MADMQAATALEQLQSNRNELIQNGTCAYMSPRPNGLWVSWYVIVRAVLEQQDALKVALAQSREDHNSMLAALGESIKLREELERERKRVKYLAATFGAQCDRHANDEIPTSCVFCALERETHRAENAERLRDEVTYESAQEIDRQITAKQAAEQQTRMDTECIERLRRVGMEAEQRLAQAEESLRGIITAEKRGETAEYLAHIAARALQPAAPQSHESLPDDRTAESHESAPAAAPTSDFQALFGTERDGGREALCVIKGLEIAETICDSEQLSETTGDPTDLAYSNGIRDCLVSIRAEIERRRAGKESER